LKQGWTAYEAANNGEPFEGFRVPLGALVYYKPSQHTSKPAFEARTVPGIFAGWRLDSGYKHKKVHLVLDYENLRTKAKGFGRPVQVHADDLVIPDAFVFPLFNAANASLEGGSGELPKIALTYVTLDRTIRFGITPGCRGCAKISEGVPHTDACHERFRELIHNEKLAKVAKEKGLAAPDTPVPAVSESAPKTPAIQAQAEKFLDAKAFFTSCHLAPGEVDAKGGKDVM